MKVSIITVCYNSASTLEETILSVQNQSYPNLEYIIVDGCSSDETVNILRSKNSVISKWISEPDNGIYDAMNKGITLSTGDLIGILNSDDIFHSSEVIKNIVNFHEENRIQASIGEVIQIRKNGDIVRYYSSFGWSPHKLSYGFMPPHPSIFFKRDVFQKYGLFDTSFKIAADYELITRFFVKRDISWKYSRITTTNMLIGGVSSSGLSSYRLITQEIKRALKINEVEYFSLIIDLRFVWKIFGLFKARIFLKNMNKY